MGGLGLGLRKIHNFQKGKTRVRPLWKAGAGVYYPRYAGFPNTRGASKNGSGSGPERSRAMIARSLRFRVPKILIGEPEGVEVSASSDYGAGAGRKLQRMRAVNGD